MAVNDTPVTQYTRSADGTNLAYQVSGEGPLEMVFLHGGGIPMDLLSEDPGFVGVRRRLGTFSRTLWLDPRGWGASEGDWRDATDAEIFDADLIAVLDAMGFSRPALVAEDVSGQRVIPFSVTRLDRISALVLIGSFANMLAEPGYPWGVPAERVDQLLTAFAETWGTAAPLELVAPSRVTDERFRAWFARSTRFFGGPDRIAHILRGSYTADLRFLLPSISVPTLVLHRDGDRVIPVEAGRYIADHIPDAIFVALPGDDHLFFVGDTDAVVDEIEEFLTGARSGEEGDVELAAVLFTDMVGSTEHQVKAGRREWSRLSDRHDAMVRAALSRYRGREVKTIGDGFLATFDTSGRALRCAAEIVATAKGIGLSLRAGLHTGEILVRGDDITGLAVTIAKRVCDLAGPGQVLVSESVRSSLVGAGISFDEQGDHELKGVPGTWRLFAMVC